MRFEYDSEISHLQCVESLDSCEIRPAVPLEHDCDPKGHFQAPLIYVN